MKTQKRHLIILLAMLAMLLCWGNNASAQYITFDISKGDVFFSVDNHYTGMASDGITVVSGDHSNSNKYKIIQSEGGSTTYTIFIETVNLFDAVPSTNNIGSSYDITLENVNIDRLGEPDPLGYTVPPASPNWGYCYQEGLGNSNTDRHWTMRYQYANYPSKLHSPFVAGDDTVDVTITLIGTNKLKGEPGANAALQYMRCDGNNSGTAIYLGTLGTGKLTLLGNGSLELVKDGSMNSGSCLGAPACGGGATGLSNGSIVIGDADNAPTITATAGGPTGSITYDPKYYGSFASAIGGGACGRSGNITIKNGTVTATSYVTSSAIGGGGGFGGVGASATGIIRIEGGEVTTYCEGSTRSDHSASIGTAIGGGSSLQGGGGSATRIEIAGGEIIAYQKNHSTGTYVPANIGGGSSNVIEGKARNGGAATLIISGGTTTCGTIGGGNSVNPTTDLGNNPSGGDATVVMSGGTVNASSIGGGNSLKENPVSGDPITGHGGYASVTVSGGTLNIAGKIGGGSSSNSGKGGNASIYVTGGTLDCASIGGGDSRLGTPGSVSATVDPTTNPLGAGVYIAGSDKITVKSGFIGGGTNTGGSSPGTVFGKATAYINATHAESSIQGQFILVNSSSDPSDYSFFIMEDGKINNSGLGVGKYARKKDSGGAIYMEDNNGVVRISGGVIQNCYAINSGNGGAVYMTNGSFTLEGDAEIQNCTAAGNGGAVYLGGGSVTIQQASSKTPSMNGNSATNGGALYMNAGICSITACNIGTTSANHASTNGGGVYIHGTITLSNGHIKNNTAGANGGGIYLDASSTITVGSGSMEVRGNTVNEVPNNIFLPDGKTINIAAEVDSEHPFNPIYVGVYTEDRTAPIPVFSGTTAQVVAVYSGMTSVPMTTNVVDDSQQFSPLDPDSGTTLYFGTSSPWSPLQRTVNALPFYNASNGGYQIGTVKELTAFLWYVNHVTGHGEYEFDDDPHPEANAKLIANIDMEGHYWVPIANYQGTFDGNGYTINHLTMVPTNESPGRGLFGINASTGTIKNVILKDCYFGTSSGYVGSIVSQNNGTLSNSVAEGELVATGSSAVMGGLAGSNGGTIHSCYAMPDMIGYQMGGLVGANSGNLYNSFANTKFTPETGNTAYMGGLVAVNTGRVENCYVRVLGGTAPTGKFGWLAGNNTAIANKGLYYNYAPNDTYVSTAEGTTSGNQTGLGTFIVTTATAYNYKAHDNQVTASGNSYVPTIANKQLVKTLNNWVTQDAAHEAAYAKWLRPTTQVINGDYPLLRMPANNSVAATSGNAALNYGDINTHISSYRLSTQAICFYGSKEGMNSNSGSSAPLYIDQDAVLTPTSAKDGDITAYVGVTLDNSAGADGATPPGFSGTDVIDWHFFSSVLTNAEIGLVYNPTTSVAYGSYPSQTTFNGTTNQYFPTNLNSYYNEWDLYAYTEPDYQWINLKRNSLSHWHEDWNHLGEHAWIDYPNDTRFEPGHGYMVALAEEHYLQAYGTLNTHEDADGQRLEVPVSYTSGISWTTREGHNLLGNPYQSYLDFRLFVNGNNALWDVPGQAFYIVMDEDKRNYVLYTYGQSANESQASRYIHPHQGFMIVSDKAGTAYFHDGMRTVTMETGWTSSFRGEPQPNYPLVNLFATDDNGNRDIVTVELGRPDKGGAIKSHSLHTGKGSLYCNYENEDYALVFTQPGLDAANIRFATDEDCAYTMTWNTQNGEFSYLHLIDNMTGVDIDCLMTDEYQFTSKTTDYKSRFRLVFDYTGIEEPSVPEPVEGPTTFAYYANGEIHLVETCHGASLQIIDMMGRVIVNSDVARNVSTNGMVPGVYILRLTTNNGSKMQKIIIE